MVWLAADSDARQALSYPVHISAEETTMAQSTSRTDEQQKRMAELRAKPEAQRSAEEKAELERLEKSQQDKPPGQGASGQERPPMSRPLDHPTPGVLSADEQGRLRELNAKRTALTDEEEKELDELRVRNTPQSAAQTDRVQRELSPDRPPAPMTDFPRDQANRLRDLRVAADMGRLSDEERSEMSRLSLEESKAAGHAEPVEAKGGPDADGSWVLYELLSFIERIISRTPAFRDLDVLARDLRTRLDDSRDSPEGQAGQPRRPGSVTETRPTA